MRTRILGTVAGLLVAGLSCPTAATAATFVNSTGSTVLITGGSDASGAHDAVLVIRHPGAVEVRRSGGRSDAQQHRAGPGCETISESSIFCRFSNETQRVNLIANLGAGDDTLVGREAEPVVIQRTAVTRVHAAGTSGGPPRTAPVRIDAFVNGGPDDDVLSHVATADGFDDLFGGDGDDLLMSGDGRLQGGDGDDRHVISVGQGGGSVIVNGGVGRDQLAWVLPAGGRVTVAGGVATAFDSAGTARLGARIGGIEVLQGTPGDDRLSAGPSAMILFGNGGRDVLIGGPRADLISGGGGDDSLNGGRGSDVFSAGDGRDTVSTADGRRDRSIRCGRGQDTVLIDGSDRVSRDCEIINPG